MLHAVVIWVTLVELFTHAVVFVSLIIHTFSTMCIITLMHTVVSALGATAEKLQSLEDAVTISSKPVQLVSVKKQVCKCSYQGVTVEQTDFTIADAQPENWRSICFEGNLCDIENLLQMKLQANGEKSLCDHLLELAGSPCGYPEFVVKICQQAAVSTWGMDGSWGKILILMLFSQPWWHWKKAPKVVVFTIQLLS